MRLQKERDLIRPLEVEMPDSGETVKLKYKSGMYTGAYLDSLSEKTGPEMLSELITEWDILDEVPDKDNPGETKEVPYPITKETIELLPLRIIHTLTAAIHEDTRPLPKKQTDSDSSW